MFRKIYLSGFGIIISLIQNAVSIIHRPFMVYGYFNKKTGSFKKNTRVSSSAKLICRKGIDLSDNVWVGHYTLIDGSGEVFIGEGVHISSHTVIYTHSSQDAIRLLGPEYINQDAKNRSGYKIRPVSIGDYTFIGTSTVILTGSKIGKGCIISAGSVINCEIPDYSIACGNPVKVIGDTRKRDIGQFSALIDESTYYDLNAIKE